MQNNVISIRKTSLYGAQPSSVVLCIQNSDLTPELLVSIGPSSYLWFFAFKPATLAPELQFSMGPCPQLWFYAFKTGTL